MPGVHPFRRQKLSEYGLRLREKQRLRVNFGVTERQLRNLVQRAKAARGDTGVALISMLESRLDNVVFRACFAPTIPAARQLVAHGHVLVDGKKCDIPSRRITAGQRIELRPNARKFKIVLDCLEYFRGEPIPSFLDVQPNDFTIGMLSAPGREDTLMDVDMNLVIEFYSR